MATARRVVIAGEDSLALAGLERLIVEETGLRVVGVRVLSSSNDAKDWASEESADAILWDLGSRGASESALPTVMIERYPILALVSDETSARAALASGAQGALLRERSVGQIVAGVDAVLSGLVVLDVDLSGSLLRPHPASLPSMEELTPREREVLEHLALGLTNREIAERLGVSPHTAKFHVNSLLGKLGAGSRTEAVALAARFGLVTF